MKQKNTTALLPFILRFAAVHTVTYAVCGILFMLVSGYFDYFAKDELLGIVMKPESALSVRLAIPVQLFRGALLALVLYPFRGTFLSGPSGWLKLFLLLFVLTGIGAVITGPGSIEGLLYTRFSYNPLIGLPETAAQALAFSWLFCTWQSRKEKKAACKSSQIS